MTVGTKVHQTLASLRTAAGNLESFALDTDNQQAKQMYKQCSQQLSQIVSQLESRTNAMEQQEPTYKISSQTGGQNGTGSFQGMTGSTQSMTGSTQGMTGSTRSGMTGLNQSSSGTMTTSANVTGKQHRTR